MFTVETTAFSMTMHTHFVIHLLYKCWTQTEEVLLVYDGTSIHSIPIKQFDRSYALKEIGTCICYRVLLLVTLPTVLFQLKESSKKEFHNSCYDKAHVQVDCVTLETDCRDKYLKRDFSNFHMWKCVQRRKSNNLYTAFVLFVQLFS